MNDGPYSLGKLSDDECWSMIKRKVLAGEEVPKELEAIQEQILRRCDGLPLAASLIGGLLLNNGKEKWHCIVQKSLLNEDQSEINQILKVSFDHLSPPSVKKCFAYCSIFSQDTELGEDELIEHWVAEGFVLPDRENTGMMEERGGEYLRILLQSSLLEKVADEGSTYYKMHDLVHDFAKSVLNPKSSSQDRYLALHSYEEMAENVRRNKPASIRSLFLHLKGGMSADMNMLSRFKHLHVLKLSGFGVMFLPSSIGKLLRLRLLDISSSIISSLPESLCKLYNLQTLAIYNFPLEEGFPKRMSDLISLRHLNYYHDDEEFIMPVQMGRLTCLQTLEFFNVSQKRGCGIEELGTLKYLKGSLSLRNLGLVKGKEAAKQAKLFEKPNLSRLVFKWKSGDRESDNCDENVLEGLQPHPNLQELEIRYFMGNKFPQWFMNLANLVGLRIEDCQRCSELPTVGQLPSLKRLYLKRLDNIRSVGDEFYASGSCTRRRKFFPALEELRVEYMENWVEWKDADQVDVFPMLRDFHILSCRKLTSIKTGYGTASIEELSIDTCDNLRELPEDVFGSTLHHSESLPHQIQYLTALTKLSLFNFGGIEVLPGWIGNLVSLETLVLWNCEKLRSLPYEAAMRRLTKLTRVEVHFCPLLRQRYTPQRGIYLEE
ncbi:unnamed protein product [Coffea canephora]|uniref:Uncharacterized protein n=1 Tax=Coffea canephora TaxID=49390 RepID=A0A068VCF9_COFCA|nr:unnamed protein product [Coffea canephora]